MHGTGSDRNKPSEISDTGLPRLAFKPQSNPQATVVTVGLADLTLRIYDPHALTA